MEENIFHVLEDFLKIQYIMKASFYNLFFKQQDITICYNSYKDHILIIQNHVYADFMNMNLSDFEIKYPHIYKNFVTHGFLIPDEKDELNLIRMEYKYEIANTRYFQLMVYPTQDCNLKCWYCYESHVKGSRMSKNIQNNIYKFIENKLKQNEFDTLNLAFFGGEPLLSFNQIAYPLATSIKSLCEKYHKTFQTFFITNASLITENMVEQLKELNAYFQITLDGCREKHNTVRVGKVKSFLTYDRIINAVRLLSNAIPQINDYRGKVLTLRINYDNDTLKNIKDLLKDLEGVKKDAIFVHLERVWQTRSYIKNQEQTTLLINAIRLFTQEGFLTGFGSFGKRRYACPAEKFNYAIVNYNGLVYKCNGRNLTEETQEGVLNDDGTITWNQNILSKRLGRTTFENEMCLACKMLPVCMGPCSQKNMERGWKDLQPVCSLHHLDMSLEQYILLMCESEWILGKKQVMQN